MRINVTKTDIENARNSKDNHDLYTPSAHCPVAQALCRRLGSELNLEYVSAGHAFMRVFNDKGKAADLMSTPIHVRYKMLRWDDMGDVEPFSFSIPDWRIEDAKKVLGSNLESI